MNINPNNTTLEELARTNPTPSRKGKKIKSAVYGLIGFVAAALGTASVTGCSSTGPDEDYLSTHYPYRIAYQISKPKLGENAAIRSDFSTHLMSSPDVAGLTLQEVDSAVYQLHDGIDTKANPEATFGFVITDEERKNNGEQYGSITFECANGNQKYVIVIGGIPRSDMNEEKRLFPPKVGAPAYVGTRNMVLDEKTPKMSFRDYALGRR